MANYAVARMQDLLNEKSVSLRGAKVLCLGAAFKRGVSDTRNSRAIHVMELLASRGAVVSYSDDLVPEVRVGDTTLRSVARDQIASTNADLVAVLVGGDWPLAALEKRNVTVLDAVNAGGPPDAGSASTRRERL
jgi:UDP-N-acetyl-D-glucosamine dehydrogenase